MNDPSNSSPKRRRRWPWIVGGIAAFLIVGGALGSHGSTGSSGTTSTSVTSHANAEKGPIYTRISTPTTQVPVQVQVTPSTSTIPTPAVDPQVQEATMAAQQYLQFTAFSRDGLIDQLDSGAGDGYPKSVATAAVDSLNIDYNAQAAKAAQQYLSFTSFSCSGLIDQLDSSAGDKYTSAQASYGAHQTAACG
jgi:hypothetical protein